VRKHLVYDRTPRHSLIDHLLVPGATSDEFTGTDSSAYEILSDALYEKRVRRSTRGAVVEFRRGGEAYQLTKTIEVAPNLPQVVIDYNLSSDVLLDHLLGVEFNFSLQEPRGLSDSTSEVEVSDGVGRLALSLRFDSPARVWTFPIKTVSQSESGYDLIYQGFSLVCLWKIGEEGVRNRVTMTFKTG
jgi:hypothetical protein